jgi:2,4-dienoyl-CoA reductase-like NADH-dependent reductase (Old Yellow Enzyme family)
MSRHEPFDFRSPEELLAKASGLEIELPFQQDLSPLLEDVTLGTKKLSNRLAVQPMEGFDANADGSPSDLTFRRYNRYAKGGSALLWFEATSVVGDGRSNPRQLWLHRQNVDGFTRLVEETRKQATQTFGKGKNIYCVLQLTHSGRYSRPRGLPQPQVALVNPFLDEKKEALHVFSDRELNRLRRSFVEAALLAYQAGFDAVDIKACHGYVINELLAAFGRQNSKYGGFFDNRIRFLNDVVKRIHQEVSQIGIAVRLNAYDGIPFPYGFGSSRDDSAGIDLIEPKQVMLRLIEEGCSLFNITAGIPYFVPYLGRPYDRPLPGAPVPPEHPLEGVYRLISITAELQKEIPEIPVVGTGYSWLRQFFPNVGAAVLQNEKAAFIGLGRSSFAYPDATRDLMNRGVLDPNKVCIACSRCTEMMRMGSYAGCVMRDKELYSKKYKDLVRVRTKNER